MTTTIQRVLLQVLAHVPTSYFHCLHCEQLFDAAGLGRPVRGEMRADYPPDLLDEAAQLAGWLQDLSERYGGRLHIQITDPQSLEGFLKSLRYWVRHYPTFIIDRRRKYSGWDAQALERLLAEAITIEKT
jgi:hypothetical protein